MTTLDIVAQASDLPPLMSWTKLELLAAGEGRHLRVSARPGDQDAMDLKAAG
ncbi:hypothetical protein OG989_05440 [Micromonospora sp. NBC_01740]|uniref:hypothetical protein n=1 Tax=Micromonospora sp. NBC_01740 TaxID=2975986 RepID=UPI002E0F94B4|nr:hypothetical protein OG989_05440 [Micromonospora sp. NBC_01740]